MTMQRKTEDLHCEIMNKVVNIKRNRKEGDEGGKEGGKAHNNDDKERNNLPHLKSSSTA